LNNKAEIIYDKTQKIVMINKPSTMFVPKYLMYLLEFQDIPKDVTIIFQEKITLKDFLDKKDE